LLSPGTNSWYLCRLDLMSLSLSKDAPSMHRKWPIEYRGSPVFCIPGSRYLWFGFG